MSNQAESIEVRAKNVNAAIEEGLRQLNLAREQVDVEVITPGSRGVLGFGAEDARVRLTPRPSIKPPPAPPPPPRPVRAEPPPAAKPVTPAPGPAKAPAPAPGPAKASAPAPSPATRSAPVPAAEPKPAAAAAPTAGESTDAVVVASAMLSELLRLMGIQASVRGHYATDNVRDKNEEPALVLDIIGNDLGILIGRRGETLTALQYVTRLMVNHKLQRWVNVVVDVEEYKNRRERTLQQLAVRTAERVAATGRTLALEPMPARERRIVHLTLRDHPEVTTQSVGEGEHRKVTVVPKKH